MTQEQLVTVTSGTLLLGVLVAGIALQGGLAAVWRARLLILLVALAAVLWALLRPALTQAFGDLAVSLAAGAVAVAAIALARSPLVAVRPLGRGALRRGLAPAGQPLDPGRMPSSWRRTMTKTPKPISGRV